MGIKVERASARKASLCLLLITCVAVRAAAQDAQSQIEREVWIPLLTASNAFDAEAFLAVQSKDMVRVSVDSKEVYGLTQYQSEIREGFKRAKQRGIVRKSEMRFLERTVSSDLAYETGYFRSEVSLPGGEKRVRFSRFEMVLRKEGGKWKILIDKDTAEGGKITEQEFRAATALRQAEVK
jgi:ketosteroid isomerase-like protein